MATRKHLLGNLHKIPTDLQKLVDSSLPLKAAWDDITPLARNEWICWITSAKKTETRIKRINRTQNELIQGKHRPCCWPGCPHR